MTVTWTVRDSNGRLVPGFASHSMSEVGRKLVPSYFDAFRLEVSHSYREVFERAVDQILQREGWQIVRVRGRLEPRSRPASPGEMATNRDLNQPAIDRSTGRSDDHCRIVPVLRQ
jgi:hypothetical protein